MRTDIVFTLTGEDRIGIVEDVTGVLLGLDANVETSRMVRLGGQFAVLMLVSLEEDRMDRLDGAISALVEEGYRITTCPACADSAPKHAGWLPYRVTVAGADHEGIIYEIAHGLSQRGITIESMDTGTTEAPVSGTPLFNMSALILVPPQLAEDEWISALAEAGAHANVDVEATAE